MFNCERLNDFYLKSENKLISLSKLLFQHCTGGPSHCKKSRKRNKKHTDWEERSKIVLIQMK